MQGVDLLDVDDLVRECRLHGVPGLRPHPRQQLALMPQIVTGLAAERLRRDAAPGLIVLAIDGVGWEAAGAAWAPDVLVPLTSTFPSTSVTGWLAAMTGRSVQEHLAPGMAYFLPEAGGVVHCVENRLLVHPVADGPGRTPDAGQGTLVSTGPTIFEMAAGLGLATVALPGDLLNHPGPWTRALLRGAARVWSGWEEEHSANPSRLVGSTIAGVDAVLAEPAGRPLLVWVFINIDVHVHRSGFDSSVQDALRTLESAVARWCRLGMQVVAHSDHGLVPIRHDFRLREAWDSVDCPALCRFPSGGAGRVRYLYPHLGQEAVVARRMEEAMGAEAVVLGADDLHGCGLMPVNEALARRIGPVVAIGVGARFPVPDPSAKFEHGGVSVEEMVVPLAAWLN